MSDDRHTTRHERKPKPVKLPAAPWERAQGGKSGIPATQAPKAQKGPSAGRKMGAA